MVLTTTSRMASAVPVLLAEAYSIAAALLQPEAQTQTDVDVGFKIQNF